MKQNTDKKKGYKEGNMYRERHVQRRHGILGGVLEKMNTRTTKPKGWSRARDHKERTPKTSEKKREKTGQVRKTTSNRRDPVKQF